MFNQTEVNIFYYHVIRRIICTCIYAHCYLSQGSLLKAVMFIFNTLALGQRKFSHWQSYHFSHWQIPQIIPFFSLANSKNHTIFLIGNHIHDIYMYLLMFTVHLKIIFFKIMHTCVRVFLSNTNIHVLCTCTQNI